MLHKTTSVFIIVFALFLNAFELEAQERYQDWTWGGPIDPLQEKFEVLHYGIDLRILPESESLEGNVSVKFKADTPLDTLRLNLIDLYSVSQVLFDDDDIPFEHFGDTLDLHLPAIRKGTVRIFYEGVTPKAMMPPWKGGFTWVKDSLDNHWMGLSCQGEGAKIFMPCLDHPSSEPWEGVDLKISVPAPYFIAANGRLKNVEKDKGEITYHWSTDYPVNNYGINFTMGIFHEEKTTFDSESGEEVPMIVYVLDYHKHKADGLMEILERSAQTQEKYFGPYPFPKDKIAIVETPYLGMEHQTINAYGNSFKYEKVGDVMHDWLLHHELGHEWWGNMVSVSDWAHFWLHEGICTYGDWLFYREFGGESRYMKQAQKVGSSIQNIKAVVAPENSNSDDAFHIEIYYKGAFIMHSLRFILGDEVFFPMLKAFLKEDNHIYDQQVTTSDFTDFVQEYSGVDLEGFFQLYLYTTDIPEIEIERKKDNVYLVSIPNIRFTLPMEIRTDKGVIVKGLSASPVEIYSEQPIEVDPDFWFLKELKNGGN